MANTIVRIIVLSFVLQFLPYLPALAAGPPPCKVLVVMSYHDEYVWQQEEKQGINSVLSKNCEVKYFNLDSKRNLQGGAEKAREAYELYRQFKPDGVIAADDVAQSLFVVPYLRKKVETPVAFCGVNGDISEYGYPAANVTGIMERYNVVASIEFLKKLVPDIRNIAFVLGKTDVTGDAIMTQIKADATASPLKVIEVGQASTLEEAIKLTETYTSQSDAIYIEHLEGLKDRHGKRYSHKEIVGKLIKIIDGKPTACANDYTVEAGCLCAVIKTGHEQGATAAKMLLKMLAGTPAEQIPVTRNYEGIRFVNITTMKHLGLNPKPEALRGVKLVKTDE